MKNKNPNQNKKVKRREEKRSKNELISVTQQYTTTKIKKESKIKQC